MLTEVETERDFRKLLAGRFDPAIERALSDSNLKEQKKAKSIVDSIIGGEEAGVQTASYNACLNPRSDICRNFGSQEVAALKRDALKEKTRYLCMQNPPRAKRPNLTSLITVLVEFEEDSNFRDDQRLLLVSTSEQRQVIDVKPIEVI